MATQVTWDRSRLEAARARAALELCSARAPDGPWVGELSSSALSTATAVCALAIVQRESQLHAPASAANPSAIRHPPSAIHAGLEWLAKNVNADGGWGDTDQSLSNLSTTALCWAAFGVVAGVGEQFEGVAARAERWLTQQAGGTQPDQLAPAIVACYGKDRTFSVPILTTLALAGRFGPGSEAWRRVLPLPFELAACPQQWFAWLRLPVVSYALPALIAIGQARAYHRPSRNPVARLLRRLTRARTLNVLTRIQPASGGFLEATPLTSFVVMSLAGSGQFKHPVTAKGVEFLLESRRPDGSWPIDTNLTTWVTTLAVNALASGQSPDAALTQPWSDPSAIGNWQPALSRWLLDQQYRERHPYTLSPPGGWAWTDLPGGVPDADDTAGALLALRHLGATEERTHEAANAGITWLLDLQNRDGGIPTFCRGWGTLPFDRSSPDLTAHALRAWAAWFADVPANLQRRIREAVSAAVGFLARAQKQDGAWVPLWFGNQFEPGDENPTYGTARVLAGILAVHETFSCSSPSCSPSSSSCSSSSTFSEPKLNELLAKGLRWLLTAQNSDGSWGGYRHSQPSIEETALAVESLARTMVAGTNQEMAPLQLPMDQIRTAARSGANWLMARVESGAWKSPSPIGFYFARLWYYERLYPMIFTVGALNQLARGC